MIRATFIALATFLILAVPANAHEPSQEELVRLIMSNATRRVNQSTEDFKKAISEIVGKPVDALRFPEDRDMALRQMSLDERKLWLDRFTDDKAWNDAAAALMKVAVTEGIRDMLMNEISRQRRPSVER